MSQCLLYFSRWCTITCRRTLSAKMTVYAETAQLLYMHCQNRPATRHQNTCCEKAMIHSESFIKSTREMPPVVSYCSTARRPFPSCNRVQLRICGGFGWGTSNRSCTSYLSNATIGTPYLNTAFQSHQVTRFTLLKT